MKEILARIRSFYIKKKKMAVGLTAAVAVLALATGVYAVLPMVNAANESGSQGNPIVLRADYTPEQVVEPDTWYKITGSSSQTYSLKYSGKGSGAAHIILENVNITLASDIPAIKLSGEETKDIGNTGSFESNFEIVISGKNTIRSNCDGAKSSLIQADCMSYTVRTYDHNSDQTSEAERFRDETVVRKNIVKFTGYGSSGDVLNLITAQDSFGAAIGSAELGTMGVNLKFSTGSGSSSYYLGTTLGYYKHGQQEFKPGSELKCGAGDIEIGSGAAIMIEGNGMGAGIGAGASATSRITYRAKNPLSQQSLSAETGTADAKAVMTEGNISITGGAVYIRTTTNALGPCIGTGAVANNGYNQGTVVITGGSVDLKPGVSGYEFGSAVNAKGQTLHKYIFNIEEAAAENSGSIYNGSTYQLENVEGGEEEYYVRSNGSDATIADDLNLSVDVYNASAYRFTGNAKAYFDSSSDTQKKLYFWLPSEVLPSSKLTVTGELPSVTYQYKVGNGNYEKLASGTAVDVKQTRTVDIKLENVPKFCTAVSYTTSTGKKGSIEKNTDDEYVYSFKMPESDCSISFTYEIGKYNISYNLEDSSVSNPNPSTYACGETLELEDPEWENHTFAGWYTTEDFQDDSRVTEVTSDTVGDIINLYAKWMCKVSFVDDEGNAIVEDIILEQGTRFTEIMYPADPEDTDEKAFEGWTVNGTDYEKGSYPEFVVNQNVTVTGRYRAIGYFVYVGAVYTNEEDYASPVDIRSMANFEMFFKEQPIAFEQDTSTGNILYKTVEFTDRSDVTTGSITAKTGYKISSVDVTNADGEKIELFTDMNDEHAFTFTMPAMNVYITVHIQAPDYKISYHDTDGSVVVPVETEDNPTVYEFNAKTPEFKLNPAPEKDKYVRFAGWYVFGDAEKKVIGSIPTGTYGNDLILVAKWEDVVTYPVNVSEDVQDYIKVYDSDGAQVTKGIPGELLTITVTPEMGVRYESMTYTYTDDDGGVYTNTKKPSEDQTYPCTYTFKMPEYPVDITGKFTLIEYQITYLNLHGADNPNPTVYTIKSVIDLEELHESGNEFIGWNIVLPDLESGYNGAKEVPISKIEKMCGNLILVAKWEKEDDFRNMYKIIVDTDSTDNKGTITAYAEEAYKGQYVFVKAAPERGYRLKRLYYSDDTIETYSAVRTLRAVEDLLGMEIDLPLYEIADGIYYFLMPDKDITVMAEFEPIEYSITYLEGNAEDNPDVYTVESVISLTTPSRTGYEFLGWYDDAGNQVTEIRDSIGNLTLTAKWKDLTAAEPETPQEPETPAAVDNGNSGNSGNGNADSQVKDNTVPVDKSVIDQLLALIRDKSKVDSSENTANIESNNKGIHKVSSEQLSTGDKANISHLVLLSILSLIILILACPKKRKEEEV